MFSVSAGKPAHSSPDTQHIITLRELAQISLCKKKQPTFHEIFLVASFRRTKKYTTGSRIPSFCSMSFPYNWLGKKVPFWWDHCLCGVCTVSHVHMGSSGDSGLLPNPKDVTWGECPMYMYSVLIFVCMGAPKTEGHLWGWGWGASTLLPELLGEAPAIHDPELKPTG